jgi:Big-like domain-containing protein
MNWKPWQSRVGGIINNRFQAVAMVALVATKRLMKGLVRKHLVARAHHLAGLIVVFALPLALCAQSETPTDRPAIRISVVAESTGSESRTIALKMPASLSSATVKAVLNGRDVSTLFDLSSCPAGTCRQATLRSADGLHPGKNVVFAIAEDADGKPVSSRLRFNVEQETTASHVHVLTSSRAKSAAVTASADAFIPPSVSFNTLTPGGYNHSSAWFQIGSQTYPAAPYPSCSTGYLVVILNRQTLQEQTAAPESSPQCEQDSIYLATYLNTRVNPADLVMVGTVLGSNADAVLNTTFIGGTNYTVGVAAGAAPNGYMAIGVGGAGGGQAYENYDTNKTASVPPFATGMLVEDVNGNYNFQSANAEEFWVSPNDPAYSGQSSITMGVPPSAAFNGITSAKYTSPTLQSGGTAVGGYWLLVLQRSALVTEPSCVMTSKTGTAGLFANCGKLYLTGDSNNTNATQAYQALGSALSTLTSDQMVILTTVGIPAWADTGGARQVAGTSYQDPSGKMQYAYYNQFAPALENLGGTPEATLTLYLQNGTVLPAYTLISCNGCGNSLTGHAALSSSGSIQQGQTGFVHGLFERDLTGNYWPTHTSQETQAQSAAGTGADFTIALLNAQQPVPWPETSGVLMTYSVFTADSALGQEAAYYYISYFLINHEFILGATGDHIDDLHYYFTGGNNTYIDYHNYDVGNLTFPALLPLSSSDIACTAINSTQTNCQWTDPRTGQSLTFTENDFVVVKYTMRNEIINFDNVLLFMVNGSTNMKDIIASGQGSVALALVGAAASVEGSTLQPPPATPIMVNTANILSLVGSVVNIAITIASDGFIPPDVKDNVVAGVTVVSDLFDSASSTAGGLVRGSTSIPSPNYTFLTTIGDLANNSLQNQLTAGFDVTLDNILGDYNRIAVIGPRVTNTSDRAFYLVNQGVTNVELSLLSQGSQRSFYLSLLPTFYSIQHFPSWYYDATLEGDTPLPDMGGFTSGNSCRSWYGYKPVPPMVNVSYPTYAGAPNQWAYYAQQTIQPVDWYIVGGIAENPSSSTQSIPYIDTQLASELFSSGGLNLPMDPFVTRTGPMTAFKFLEPPASPFDGFSLDNTCSATIVSSYGVPDGPSCKWNNSCGVSSPPPAVATSTALSVSGSSVLGEALPMQAIVTAGSAAASGIVTFQDNGVTVSTATLDAKGSATVSVSGLDLGAHAFVAFYLTNAEYLPSESAAVPTTVYANNADLSLTASLGSLQLSYGSTSAPLNVQVTSEWGLAGAVSFACSGLPVGATCAFNPAQVTLVGGGTASTSLSVTEASPVQKAGVLPPSGGAALLVLPLSLLSLWRVRRGAASLGALLCLLAVSFVPICLLSGCGGGNGTHQPQNAQSQTVLIVATSGTVTRSIPIIITVQ